MFSGLPIIQNKNFEKKPIYSLNFFSILLNDTNNSLSLKIVKKDLYNTLMAKTTSEIFSLKLLECSFL